MFVHLVTLHKGWEITTHNNNDLTIVRDGIHIYIYIYGRKTHINVRGIDVVPALPILHREYHPGVVIYSRTVID